MTTPESAGSVTPTAVAHLLGTKPWVRFLAILGFIGTALTLVLAALMPFVGAFSKELGAPMGLVLAVVYLLAACLYFFPSLLLFRYGSAIGRLGAAQDAASLERALECQKAFWRLVGILAIATLCLYVLLMVVMVAVGIASTMTG